MPILKSSHFRRSRQTQGKGYNSVELHDNYAELNLILLLKVVHIKPATLKGHLVEYSRRAIDVFKELDTEMARW